MTITKIQLNEMKFYAYHGVMPQEKAVGNLFTVNLSFTAPLQKACETDCLADTIHYGEVYEAVSKEMQSPSELLEHAAMRILKSLRQRFLQMHTIEISLSKPNPPFGGDVQSVTFTIVDNPTER